ncbi:MAG TPA: ABC transporter permease [Candidatus Acidoferrales bacterium]|nr:ABC transporter permease [Candidatus Acidoferrales bacterium]
MHKLWLIIKREYITRVKTRGFVIGTVIVPLLGVGVTLLIVFLVGHQSSQAMRIAIVDEVGGIAPSVASGLDTRLSNGQPQFNVVESIDRPADPEAMQKDLRSKINAGALDGYLVIPADVSHSVELHTKNAGNFSLLGPITSAVNEAVVEARLKARGIHVDNVRELVKSADFKVMKVTKEGESVERGQTFGIAVALVILLYMSLLMYGIITMRSVLEEKTTRTMEVLISAVTPSQLLAGKILGVAGVAMTQFLIWGTTVVLLGSYGVAMAAMGGAGSIMSGIHVPASLMICAVIYFFCGYFLYSAMFAAVGAACSNEQDAQQLQWIAMAPLVFTMLIYSVVLNDSTSRLSVILSEIPFFSPVLMPLRVSLQTPPLWQLALSIVLLLLSIAVVVLGSAKIYRVGILMYGKRPTLPELVRWLRYS